MNKIRYVSFVLFLGIVLFFIAPSKAFAVGNSVIGKAKVATNTTDNYLDFNASPFASNVTISATGVFSGFAWSGDLGWIAFGTENNPAGPVSLELSTGKVTGKAKVINTTDNYLDFNASPYASNVTYTNSTKAFAGYVWSGDIGWINFGDTGVFTADFSDSENPEVSADGFSDTWYNTERTAVITATDGGGSGLVEVRYKWGDTGFTDTDCDSGSGGTLASPLTGQSLSDDVEGSRTLYLCARDSAGNKATPWSNVYRWETTIPTGPESVTANGGNHYVKTSTFDLVMNDPNVPYIGDTGGSGLVSPNPYRVCKSVGSENTATGCDWVTGATYYTSTATITDLPADGTTRYYYGVTFDNAGNNSLFSTGDYITRDTTPPTTTVVIDNSTYSPSTFNSVETIHGTASDGTSGVASTKISIYNNGSQYWNGSTWQTGAEILLNVTTGPTAWKYTMNDANFTNGSTYTVTAKATDVAGNETLTGGYDTFTYDDTPPAPPSGLTLKTPATSPGKVTKPTITVSDVVNLDVVRLYTDACITQVGIAPPATGNTVDITTTADLSEGSYTFRVDSTDPLGNRSGCSTGTVAYVLDTTLPSATGAEQYKEDGITEIPLSSSTLVGELKVVLEATVGDTLSSGNALHTEFEVKPIGTKFDETGLYTSSNVVYTGVAVPTRITTSNLSVGTGYHWQYRAIDTAGNVSDWTSFGLPNLEAEKDFAIAAITIIEDLPDGITVVLAADTGTDMTDDGGAAITTLEVILKIDDILISDIVVDMTENRSWSNVIADVDTTAGKSVVANLTTAAGAIATHSLYIPIPTGGNSDGVLICPNATTLEGITETCIGGTVYTLQSPGVTQVTSGGITYWRVSGLTGTGGLSILANISDTSMTRLQVNELSNHYLDFTTKEGLLGPTDNILITFPVGFDFNGITYTDIDLLQMGSQLDLAVAPVSPTLNTWGVTITGGSRTILLSPPIAGSSSGYIPAGAIIQVNIGTNAINPSTGTKQIRNPVTAGQYSIDVLITNAQGEETGTIAVPIVDSDQVDITGFVTSYIHFDIDTSTDNRDCAYNICKVHGGVGASTGTNYTVDLGELSSTSVNKSMSTSVDHNGTMGVINAIYFDLTTNAISGAVVTVRSANGGLVGPGGSGTNLITSVTDGQDIFSNSGKYGYNLTAASTMLHGAITTNTNCNSGVKYCGPVSTGTKEVFNTQGHPIDSARVRMDIAAGATYTNNPGVYIDTLTFVATATF